MTITKYGQCCLLLEVAGKRILTDPGAYSTGHEDLTNLDIILITHEHGDHCHTESIATLLENNPAVTIVTNTSVAKLLASLNIDAHILEGREVVTIADTVLEAYEGTHVEIFEDFGMVQNTGYFVAETLFYPGDAYTVPDKHVHILALPVAGPWCKASDAVHYALHVAPDIAVPVHDEVLSEVGKKITYGLFAHQLTPHNITFVPLVDKEAKVID